MSGLDTPEIIALLIMLSLVGAGVVLFLAFLAEDFMYQLGVGKDDDDDDEEDW